MTFDKIFNSVTSRATKYHSVLDRPPLLASGSGAILTDTKGRDYIDFGAGSAVMNCGYGLPEISAAVQKQIATGVTHAGPHFLTEIQLQLADRVLGLMPSNLVRLHPATNGTEAIEIALKMARLMTGGDTFVAFRGSYHGRTHGALAVSGGKAANARLGSFSPQAAMFPFPDCRRCRFGGPDECCGRIEDDIVDALHDRKNGLGPLAGIIVEPIQGTGGILVPPMSFLKTLRRLADEFSVPLIYDEVFTCFGRTGKLFAMDHTGIVPDMLVLAKNLGGSFPIGAVAMTAAVDAAQDPGSQSSTFQLSPVGAAAGLAAMNYILEKDLPNRACEIHERFMHHFRAVAEIPGVSDNRGIGAMHGIELSDPATGAPNAKRAKDVRAQLLQRGVISYECGRDNNVVGLLPPLVISNEQIDEGVKTVMEVLSTVP